MNDNTVYRAQYLAQLNEVRHTPDIKVITGVRRSGKSVLLRQFIDQVQAEAPSANVIMIDFNDIRCEPLREYHKLYEYVEAHWQEGADNLLCIDEVQECPQFERALNSLHNSGRYDIYVTGSNAFLLSSELATYFTGRYIEIKVLPFSFREFSDYFVDVSDLRERFELYTTLGGMPGSYPYRRDSDKRNYLRSVVRTITERDMVQRYKIRDTAALNNIVAFLMDNVGNLTSANRVSSVLSSGKKKDSMVSYNTVASYITHLTECFLFYESPRFDIQGNAYLERNSKLYLVDHGLRRALLGSRNINYGRLYENLVYLELLRRGYEVYTGKWYQREIDFVAKRDNELIYIQVSDDISSEETLRRELVPLLSIKDAYPKHLIANTHHSTYTQQGVIVSDLAQWLMNS